MYETTVILHLALFIRTALAGCYFAAGKEANSNVVPCSDPAYGVAACCQNGDVCLEDNVCWNNSTGTTYLYGCTDSSYADSKCPSKCGFNTDLSNWVGLVWCSSEGGWACHAPESCHPNCPSVSNWPPAVQSLPPQSCSDLSPMRIAFKGPNPLTPYLHLPRAGDSRTTYFSPSGTWYAEAPNYTPQSVLQEVSSVTATSAAASTAAGSSAARSEPSSTHDSAAPTTASAKTAPTTAAATTATTETTAESPVVTSFHSTFTHTVLVTSTDRSGDIVTRTSFSMSDSVVVTTKLGSNATDSSPTGGVQGGSPNQTSKIAIGVGAGVGAAFLILAGTAAFFLLRRRRQNRNSGLSFGESQPGFASPRFQPPEPPHYTMPSQPQLPPPLVSYPSPSAPPTLPPMAQQQLYDGAGEWKPELEGSRPGAALMWPKAELADTSALTNVYPPNASLAPGHTHTREDARLSAATTITTGGGSGGAYSVGGGHSRQGSDPRIAGTGWSERDRLVEEEMAGIPADGSAGILIGEKGVAAGVLSAEGLEVVHEIG